MKTAAMRACLIILAVAALGGCATDAKFDGLRGQDCTEAAVEYRDYLHDDEGVPYDDMRFVLGLHATGSYHLWLERRETFLGIEGWWIYDPQAGTYAQPVGYYEHYARVSIYPGHLTPRDTSR